MELATALSGLKLATDLIKESRELLRAPDVKREELVQNFVEAQGLVVDARAALVDLLDENAKLRSQIALISDARDNYVFRENVYWRREDGEGPFCPQCLDTTSKPVRLINLKYSYRCTFHETNYVTDSQRRAAESL